MIQTELFRAANRHRQAGSVGPASRTWPPQKPHRCRCRCVARHVRARARRRLRSSPDVCGWEEARNRASNQGGHLASITSEAENAFIVALGVGRSWIGAFQEPGACEPGCFSWVTGEPWQYQRWMGGQPDGFAGSENYVEIRANSYWNDLNAGWGACP